MISIFFLGATGYIGGAVLVEIKSAYPDAKITALSRSKSNVNALKDAGVTDVIIGTHADLEVIRTACAEADVVVNAADADDLPLTRAVIAGLRARAKKVSGRRPLLIHTSGTGVVSDKAQGNFTKEAEKIWNDNSVDDIRSIRDTQPHRLIDLEIFKADERGDVSAWIIAPSTIYGVSKGPVRKISQQVPNMIRAAVRRRQTVYVGEGTNQWNNVHIDDVVELYLLVLKHALSGGSTQSSYEKFYFGSVDEHVWGDVAQGIAPLLRTRGLVDHEHAISVPPKDEPAITASNSRSVSERGRVLGWIPKAKGFMETLVEDVDATIASLNV